MKQNILNCIFHPVIPSVFLFLSLGLIFFLKDNPETQTKCVELLPSYFMAFFTFIGVFWAKHQWTENRSRDCYVSILNTCNGLYSSLEKIVNAENGLQDFAQLNQPIDKYLIEIDITARYINSISLQGSGIHKDYCYQIFKESLSLKHISNRFVPNSYTHIQGLCKKWNLTDVGRISLNIEAVKELKELANLLERVYVQAKYSENSGLPSSKLS